MPVLPEFGEKKNRWSVGQCHEKRREIQQSVEESFKQQSSTEVAGGVVCEHLEQRAMLGTSLPIMRRWHGAVS